MGDSECPNNEKLNTTTIGGMNGVIAKRHAETALTHNHCWWYGDTSANLRTTMGYLMHPVLKHVHASAATNKNCSSLTDVATLPIHELLHPLRHTTY